MNILRRIRILIAAGALIGVACTPAQSAALSSDAQLAASILAALSPVACAIVDAVDPAQAAGICQVITDVASGATAIVPVFGTLGALSQVVAARPANAAVTAAVPTVHVSRRAAGGR